MDGRNEWCYEAWRIACRVVCRIVPYRLSNVKKEEMEGSKLEAEDEEDKKKIKRKTTTCTF